MAFWGATAAAGAWMAEASGGSLRPEVGICEFLLDCVAEDPEAATQVCAAYARSQEVRLWYQTAPVKQKSIQPRAHAPDWFVYSRPVLETGRHFNKMQCGNSIW